MFVPVTGPQQQHVIEEPLEQQEGVLVRVRLVVELLGQLHDLLINLRTEDVGQAGCGAGAHGHPGQLPVQLPVKLEDVVSHHEVEEVDQQVGGHGHI